MRQSPANRILLLLKTEGPQLGPAVGDHLGISAEAARQQLTKLAEEGLTEPVSEPSSGRGRPKQLWQLTPSGHQTFPDGQLGIITAELGPGALDAVISARETETLARYRQDVSANVLADRVKQLAAVRSREGYMADSWQEEDGSFMLVENHCPICAAAAVCAGFCRSEIETFRAVLGATVERSEHILLGARRCAYRISA
jgi:predicted ArsR family transcriptional regulator